MYELNVYKKIINKIAQIIIMFDFYVWFILYIFQFFLLITLSFYN